MGTKEGYKEKGIEYMYLAQAKGIHILNVCYSTF